MNTHQPKTNRNRRNPAVRIGLALGAALVLLAPAAPAARPAPDNGRPVAELVRNLEVGRPVSHGNLTIVPVYLTEARSGGSIATLDEAVQKGLLEITELNGGRVPQVKISNLSKSAVFLMGGEIISGAKQDRILASDVLIGPGTRNLVVPVYCVEHGRWTATTDRFTSKSNVGTFDLRAKAQEKGASAQTEIWDRVAEQNAKVGVASPTSAYQDAYASEANKAKIRVIEERMTGIPRLSKDAVGVVIGLNGRVISSDLFLNPALFQKQWPKILRASALSSIGSGGRGTIDQAAAAAFLKRLMGKDYQAKKGLDLGTELQAIDDEANVQALLIEAGILHLSAFPQERGRIKVVDGPDQEAVRIIRDEGGAFRQAVLRDDARIRR